MGCGAVAGIRDTSTTHSNYPIASSSSVASSLPHPKKIALNINNLPITLPSSNLIRIKHITSMSEVQDIVDSKTIPPDGKNVWF